MTPVFIRPLSVLCRRACLAALLVVAFWIAGADTAWALPALALQTGTGGVTVSGTDPNWSAGFGNTNGLGVGTPSSGVSLVTAGLTGGVLYTTPINLIMSGTPQQGIVSAYVSTNFVHSTALDLRVCLTSCTSSANYTALSLSSASPTSVTGAVSNGTTTVWLGLFVKALVGAGAFAGTDTVTVTLLTTQANNGQLRDTDVLTLNNPSVTVQSALRLQLATAGGLSISPASDYSASFGSVNGLGIGPASGLAVSTDTGGMLYSTPYSLQPVFAGFTSSLATLKAHVSTDFVHPAVLELRDSATGSSFAALSKNAAAPTTFSSSVSTGVNLTRYLGLFVSGLNGASAFTGPDTATVTFTLVVP